MVTVKQFLDAGFGFVCGDKTDKKDGEHSKLTDTVKELVWRKNTGAQPVDDDCWVEVLRCDTGETDIGMASEYLWNGGVLVKWKPSLKHLDEQMNDNQEIKTALEMSERDIENYTDNCDVERELKESDGVVWESGDIAFHEGREVLVVGWHPHHPLLVVEGSDGFFTISSYKLSKSLTPERDEAVNAMLNDAGYICTVEDYRLNKLSSIMDAAIESMFELYDAGYRKQ